MNDSDKRKLHDQVRLFTEESKAIDVEASRIYYLISANGHSHDIIKDINKLQKRIGNFKADADKIDLKKFNTDENEQNREFGVTGSKINNLPKEKSDFLKKIKQELVRKYNFAIDMLNKEISFIKTDSDGVIKKQTDASKKTSLENEIDSIKNNVPVKKNSRSVGANTNLDDVDLDALQKRLSEVRKFVDKNGTKLADGSKNMSIPDEFDTELDEIKGKLVQLDYSIVAFKTSFGISVTAANLDSDLSDIRKSITDNDKYLSKLIAIRSRIPEDVYKKYVEEVQKVLKQLDEKEETIKKAKETVNNASITTGTIYKGHKDNLDNVTKKVTDIYNMYIVRLYNNRFQKLTAPEVLKINKDLDKLKDKYDAIKTAYDNDKTSGTIQEQLHKNLEDIYKIRVDALGKIREELTNPKAIVEGDVNVVLSDSVESIKQGIDELREIYNNYGSKRVIPKKTRKEIDKLIAKIEEKIDLLKRNLDSIEDDKRDEKYTKMLDSLKEQEDRLTSFKKDYRKKTPFLVKRKKSAKEWFKKHKKGLLIAAGIASVALLMQPLLIPAIMHGNIMLFAIHPSWKAALVGINNVLGKIIGAKTIGGAVTLANGVMITPVTASATILKALASIGLPTAAIATPLVAGIVDLVKKIKSGELKRQLKSGKDKIVNAPKAIHDRYINRDNVRTTKKELRRLKNLLLEYERSRLSLNDFANDKSLPKSDKDYLEAHATRKHGGR